MSNNEQQQDENKLIAERRAKLAKIREQASADNTSAFPNDFRRENLAADLQAEYGEQTKDALETLDHQVSVAGRVIRNRGAFMVIQDMSGTIQLYVVKE
ncbi:MAG TPA: lysine--tRNA ligase, partial [Porticoccus sp.]|nr:lysine--tRNA ligase [Porticoccus sp.]